MAREIVSNTHQIVFLLCLAPPAAPHHAQNEARVLRPAGPQSLAFCLCPGASPSPLPCWSTPASLGTSLSRNHPKIIPGLKLLHLQIVVWLLPCHEALSTMSPPWPSWPPHHAAPLLGLLYPVSLTPYTSSGLLFAQSLSQSYLRKWRSLEPRL